MRRFVKLKALFLFILLIVTGLSVVPSIAQVGGEETEAKVPSWISDNYDRAFTLGLDLQGGLHLEYSVAVDEALENKLDRVAGELEAAFREKKPDVKVAVARSGIDKIILTFEDPSQLDQADDDVMGITFGLLERGDEDPNEGTITMKVSDELLNQDRTAIIGQALDTVRRRVDAMGIAEPNIYPKNRQIVIELPGLTDTSTEVRAAADESAEALRSALKNDGAPQVIIAELEEDPGAFVITTPDSSARGLLAKTFGSSIIQSDKGEILVDERIGIDLAVLPDERGAEADPAVVRLALTETARDEVLEESSNFRRLLKVIERAAVLEMHMVDDETLYKDSGEPYLKALYEARMVTEGMGISVNVEPDYGREGGTHVTEP
jgi:preprotein translocase subunit SecD